MRKYDVHFTKMLGMACFIFIMLGWIVVFIGNLTPQPAMVESGKIPLEVNGHQNGYALHSNGAPDIRAFGVEERDGEIYLIAIGCDASDGTKCITLRRFKSTESDCSHEWQEAVDKNTMGLFGRMRLFFRICKEQNYFEIQYDPAVWTPS